MNSTAMAIRDLVDIPNISLRDEFIVRTCADGPFPAVNKASRLAAQFGGRIFDQGDMTFVFHTYVESLAFKEALDKTNFGFAGESVFYINRGAGPRMFVQLDPKPVYISGD